MNQTKPKNVYPPPPIRLYSVGKTIPGTKSRLSEPNAEGEGEFCMWGRNVMMGYLGREDKTTEDVDPEGWMHSGDMATKDGDDFYYITGEFFAVLKWSGVVVVAVVPAAAAVVVVLAAAAVVVILAAAVVVLAEAVVVVVVVVIPAAVDVVVVVPAAVDVVFQLLLLLLFQLLLLL